MSKKRNYKKTFRVLYSNGSSKVHMELRVPAYLGDMAIVRRSKLMVGITGKVCDRSDIGKRVLLQRKDNKGAVLQIFRKVA